MSGFFRNLVVMTGLISFCGPSAFARPEWADAAPILKGKDLKIVCRGVGPSPSQASGRAIEACQAEASSFMRTDVSIRSLVIQTEKESALHEEVYSSLNFKNLKCIPERRELEERDQIVTSYQECRFDLSKVNVEKVFKKNSELPLAKVDKGSARLISVSSAPQCESIIIEGTLSSVTRCLGNPVQVRTPSGSVDIIVRASGYLPKKIRVTPESEDVHVSLDPN